MECLLVNEVRWNVCWFGKEVLGGCYGSWADDCASDDQKVMEEIMLDVGRLMVDRISGL